MALALKYNMPFKTTENVDCKVEFHIEGYSGSVITINAAESPFVLREFNTDDDIFKPVRGQQADINIVASSSLNIDDFIGNSDTYCKIYFYYYNMITPFWEGWLSQDDLQQEWTNQNKIIQLKASDGFGYLKNQYYTDTTGNEVRGINTIFSYIYNSLYNTSAFDSRRLYFINSLFNDTIDDTSLLSPLAQLYLDARTFSIGDGEYDDKYTVLEKVNTAFNQTVFQYNNGLYTFRIEDIYCPTSTNLRRYRYNSIAFPNQWSYTTLRYDVNIGANQAVKPIEPKMLRMVNRNVKMNENDFYYNYPTEFIPNQNFKRGTLVSSTSSLKTYTVLDWECNTGQLSTPTTSTGYRYDELDTNGYIFDSYIRGTGWWRSTPIYMNKNDVLDLSFLWSPYTSITDVKKIPVAQVYLKTSASSFYFLDDNGDWTFHSNINIFPLLSYEILTLKLDTGSTISNGRYLEKSVLSKPLPAPGYLFIVFGNTNLYSQVQFRYQAALANVTTSNVAGFKETYTKSEDIRQNDIEQIYMIDTGLPAPAIGNTNVMGSIIYSPGTPGTSASLPTEPDWYRLRYNSESFSFLRQNLTARYNFNKFNRTKIDANFYGVANGNVPIGLLNTFIFTDDDPNKIYYLANLKEMDFANNTWSGTLIEVWDTSRDTDTATTYPTYAKDFLYK
jgi:hypothetical protein